ncbi:hypothetical protein [Mycobacterium aquaticum]|uniref:DUF3068 domain-containing protein n=1 Tax=Mycobacterium aquaticum TaxID=1927124 RepID=A0A1W9ZVU7_9MYCO|nr:hypothetical protein [Mycobacterium aquaticum]ORA21785.1 hypothetical protein BST13_37215 [Mycobacterium aquaticum]
MSAQWHCRWLGAAAVAAAAALAACGSNTAAPASSSSATQAGSPTAGASARAPLTIADPYQPRIDPAAFTTTIDNPYFPLVPGTRIIYEADTAGGRSRTVTEVTRDTKTVMGVATVVVHDIVTLNGKTTEDTLDWYAQDRDGNVWYFGEDTKAFEDGQADPTGSFEAGVAGALPGIVMPGNPQIGDAYRQEYAKGIAEDTGTVHSLTGAETTPLTGPANDLLVIQDADQLDPTSPAEHKYYARGIGLVLTQNITGPAEREQAVTIEKF